jgi:hypothetical protein
MWVVHRAINLFDHIQRGMNPEADPKIWPFCIKTKEDLPSIRQKLSDMRAVIDYPFQHYKKQSLSGHIFYLDRHQLHIRVFPLKVGYGLKAHYEWNAKYCPLKHLACKDLSYPEGCRRLKRLWNASKEQ